MPGKFIVFEGIDGSGKGTCIRAVSEYFNTKEIPHTTTEEPSKYGIRKIIKEELITGKINDPVAELFLFSLDRRIHLLTEVEPALKAGKHVLCDRYWYSTIVYQGYLQDVSIPYIEKVQSIFRKPDLVLLLDLPAKIALERIGGRKVKEKFDALNALDTLQRAYLNIAKIYGFKIINAAQPEEQVAEQAIKALKEIIEL